MKAPSSPPLRARCPLDARLRLVQPLKCRPNLLDEVGRGGGPAPLAEGLGGARPRQAAGGPPGQDPGARVGALRLEARRPVHEDGQRAGEEVALSPASGGRRGLQEGKQNHRLNKQASFSVQIDLHE